MDVIRSAGEVRYRTEIVRPLAVREASPSRPSKPKLLDRVREAIRTRHYSRRTEKSTFHGIRRFILFHGKRHPAEMGAAEVSAS